MNEINQSVTELVASQIDNINMFRTEIVKSLHILLNGNFIKYDIENVVNSQKKSNLSEDSFQKKLSNVNEKTKKRKNNGVYYTPNDVTKYIICNTFINNIVNTNERTYNYGDGLQLLNNCPTRELKKIIYKKSVIDPTCGAGEFLINAFELKYSLAKSIQTITDEKILQICDTIFGNDIDGESVDIAKIRIFFNVLKRLKQKSSIERLARILNEKFYNMDFVISSGKIIKRFDIVIGNPPYVEYRKYQHKDGLIHNFGNIYADVLSNSISILNDGGVMGYVVPLSYTSTQRMASIRNYLIQNTDKQFILSFGDRPDCLFAGVHQKLNIIIAKKGRMQHLMYTSNYKHWCKEERTQLLNGREVRLCVPYSTKFIPKIGNIMEETVFRKVYTITTNNIFELQNREGKPLFLNMRACFWIKAFSFNPGSSEYKAFYFEEKYYDFVLCVLNSSLFWLYWTIMSDCWHITSKEIKGFYIAANINISPQFAILAKKLEIRLEKTKKYVGSKQVDYEYKHRLCKDIIDKIDDELAIIYNLSEKECEYVKMFAIRYRSGV